MELWKTIEDSSYEISSLGRVRNSKGEILKTRLNRNGYERISIRINKKLKTFSIHRLVGIYFIENPNSYPQINHKDENKLNNTVENLEWCTPKYNSNYGTRPGKISKRMLGNKYGLGSKGTPKRVMCIETGMIFESCVDAEKFYGIKKCSVKRAANPKQEQKYAGSYTWRYCND